MLYTIVCFPIARKKNGSSKLGSIEKWNLVIIYWIQSIKLFFSFHMFVCIHVLSNDHSFNPVSDQRSISEFPPFSSRLNCQLAELILWQVVGEEMGPVFWFVCSHIPMKLLHSALLGYASFCFQMVPGVQCGLTGNPLHATLRFETTDAIFTFLHLAGFYWHLSIKLPVLVLNPNVTNLILVFSLEVTSSLWLGSVSMCFCLLTSRGKGKGRAFISCSPQHAYFQSPSFLLAGRWEIPVTLDSGFFLKTFFST